MAIISSLKSAPVRSISLPSRLNPHSTKIEAELNKLNTWKTSLVSADSLSADVLRTGFVGLAELYNSLEELVHSPLTQQAMSQCQNGKILEEALDGSIGLLDSCTMARDLSSMLKESVRNLQTFLRRKTEILSMDSRINAYRCCKRKMKKESVKCLRELKKMENVIGSTIYFDENAYVSMVIRILREVASITISILRSVFLLLSGQVITKAKPSRWSLISNVMLKSSSMTNEKHFNEVQSLDVAMQRSSLECNAENTRKRLEDLDQGLGGVELGLDCLFRCLVKNRVSLLNIMAE